MKRRNQKEVSYFKKKKDEITIRSSAAEYLTYTPLPSDEQEEFCQLIKSIKNADEQDINRLTELSVKWVTLNLDPIAVGKVNYRR